MMNEFFVHDSSPLDDYADIRGNVFYTIKNNVGKLPDKSEKPGGGGASERVKGILVISAIVFAVILVLTLITFFMGNRKLSGVVVFIVMAAAIVVFDIALWVLLVCGCAKWVCGIRSDMSDIKRTTTTWILRDGRVVVSDEQVARGIWLFDKMIDESVVSRAISEVPYHNLRIIQGVYDVKERHGKIIAYVEGRHIYLTCLHGLYEAAESCFDFSKSLAPGFLKCAQAPDMFYYRERRGRMKVVWDKCISDRKLLLDSLRELPHRA